MVEHCMPYYMYMPYCMPDHMLNCMPHDMLLCYG